MRKTAILILLVIGFSILSPMAIVFPTGGASSLSIQTLDVCHSGSSFVDPELPGISHFMGMPFFMRCESVALSTDLSVKPELLAFQDEHPPKA